MIKNIFPFILFFSFVSPISWTTGDIFSQLEFKTLENLSSQSSKILTDFQGKDRLDTQINESSPRALIHHELESNRINNLKINDEKSYSGIEKKALLIPKSSRAFLMPVASMMPVATLLVHSVSLCKLCYTPKTVGESGIELEKALEISNHLKVDKVIEMNNYFVGMIDR